MPNLRQTITRRWVVFALVVAALAWFAWWLGEWQFHRLEDRRERNEVIATNEERVPTAVEDVVGVGEPVAESDEWRRVTARGTYDVEDTVIVRYRTRGGKSGVNVVVPLRLADGSNLLVDRGWFATSNKGVSTADVPSPPPGEVEVVGWLRRDGEGGATKVSDHSTRAISGEVIGEALDLEVRGGFAELVSESPEPDQSLEAADLPELDEGPHFFYGLQWWFFGALAVFGFGYLLVDEMRGGRSGGRRPRRTPEDGGPHNNGPESDGPNNNGPNDNGQTGGPGSQAG